MTYTPGPWFKSEHRPDPIKQPIMAKTKGGAAGVAEVYLPPYPQHGEGNADLIAAAPDLYEALQRLNDAVESGDPIAHWHLVNADKALSKARGETEGRN